MEILIEERLSQAQNIQNAKLEKSLKDFSKNTLKKTLGDFIEIFLETSSRKEKQSKKQSVLLI